MDILGMEIEKWLESYKKNSVKPATYDRLITSLKLMSNYDIYRLPTELLAVDVIQEYVNSLVDDRYSLSTIKKQYNLLSAYIDYANVAGYLDRPYYKGVRIPARSIVKKQSKEIRAYSKEEQQLLLDIMTKNPCPAYYAAILMLETGMRIGEVLALNWRDILWNRRAIRIDKTLVRLGNRKKSYIQHEPKTYSSKRTIPVSTRALDILNLLRETDEFNEFVIHDECGKPLSYESCRWHISKACKEAGVPYYGQHAFRHTFATNMYEKGCNVKILSKMLGHADTSVTYNVYIHLFGDGLEEMRLILD